MLARSRAVLTPIMMSSLLLLAACAVSLSPAYDPGMVEGLQSANERTLTLFSALSAGGTKAGLAQQGPAYDAAIGAFKALKVRAEARLVPPLSGQLLGYLKKNAGARGAGWITELCDGDGPGKGGGGVGTECVYPVPGILDRIVGVITMMKTTQGGPQGLKPDGTQLFQQQYLLYIEQALTIEMALKRS